MGAERIDAAGAAVVDVRVDVRWGVAARREKVDARRRVRRRGVPGCVLAVVDAGFSGIPRRGRRRRERVDVDDASSEWVRERVAAERDAAKDRFRVAHRFGNQDGRGVVDEEINPG